jgi:hypothetical protein
MKVSVVIISTLADTDTYSTLLRNLLLTSVQQNILQHSTNVSTCHGFTDGGNEYAFLPSVSRICYEMAAPLS